jgi:NADPH-dependent F420 reductase
MIDSSLLLTIAVIGGSGKEGKGLAYRWAKAGYRVLIGSRSPEKAIATSSEIIQLLEGGSSTVGMTNLEAVMQANVVVLTVPYNAHQATLELIKGEMAGKILIDVTVPINRSAITKVKMPPAGSAAQEAKQILGESSEVAAAFHSISHEYLLQDKEIESEVLVTGTSKETRDEAIKLVFAAGLKGWDAGPLENSVVIEGLTSVLININKRYGSTNAGIKITGVVK